jgi:hypothetical protein
MNIGVLIEVFNSKITDAGARNSKFQVPNSKQKNQPFVVARSKALLADIDGYRYQPIASGNIHRPLCDEAIWGGASILYGEMFANVRDCRAPHLRLKLRQIICDARIL